MGNMPKKLPKYIVTWMPEHLGGHSPKVYFTGARIHQPRTKDQAQHKNCPNTAQLESPDQHFFPRAEGASASFQSWFQDQRLTPLHPKTARPKTLRPKTKNPTTCNLWARLSVCQVVFNVGQEIFAAADCRPNKKPNPIMAEELACSMCFIVKQQSLDIVCDVGEPEGAVWDHFVIKRH